MCDLQPDWEEELLAEEEVEDELDCGKGGINAQSLQIVSQREVEGHSIPRRTKEWTWRPGTLQQEPTLCKQRFREVLVQKTPMFALISASESEAGTPISMSSKRS